MAMRVKRKKTAIERITRRARMRPTTLIADQLLECAFAASEKEGGELMPAILAVGPPDLRRLRRLARRLEKAVRIVIRLAPDRAEVWVRTPEGHDDELLFRRSYLTREFYELRDYVASMPAGKEVAEVLLGDPRDKTYVMRVEAPLEIERVHEPLLFNGEEVEYGLGDYCVTSFDFRAGIMVTHRFETAMEASVAKEVLAERAAARDADQFEAAAA